MRLGYINPRQAPTADNQVDRLRVLRYPGDMSNPAKEIGMLLGIRYGSYNPSPEVEDTSGLRDYLFCVGIHISRNSRRRPRSSTVSSRGDAFLRCGARSLLLDDRAGRA